MTMPERAFPEIQAEVQQMLARARPEQLRRLIADIKESGAISGRDGDGSADDPTGWMS